MDILHQFVSELNLFFNKSQLSRSADNVIKQIKKVLSKRRPQKNCQEAIVVMVSCVVSMKCYCVWNIVEKIYSSDKFILCIRKSTNKKIEIIFVHGLTNTKQKWKKWLINKSSDMVLKMAKDQFHARKSTLYKKLSSLWSILKRFQWRIQDFESKAFRLGKGKIRIVLVTICQWKDSEKLQRLA